jgi:FMN phosphatase YigB (HAD superfamily)
MNLSTILFDLDGTLLDIDFEEFFPVYLDALGRRFQHLMNTETFEKHLMRATEIMMHNPDGRKTNEEVFKESFALFSGLDPMVFVPVFEDYYREEFPSLGYFAKHDPFSVQVVETAVRRGLNVVVATCPIFPYQAIAERIRWAGLDPEIFKLITSFEVMHSCKPYPRYYEEILEMIDRGPEECMMVGNDVEDDMPAKEAGIRTFLFTRQPAGERIESVSADYCGNFTDLEALISGECEAAVCQTSLS